MCDDGLMDDLVAFLAARLDEDEAAAYKAAGGLYRGAGGRFGGRPHWSALGHGIVADAADLDRGVVDLGPCIDDDALAEHIVRHDPARVLREIEAGRARLAYYQDAQARLDRIVTHPGEVSSGDEGMWLGKTAAARMACRHDAAIWGDHPDYRPEWKP